MSDPDWDLFKIRQKMENETLKRFNKKQRLAYDCIVNMENLFLTGPGGTGKSEILKTFARLHRGRRIVAVTSTTGISAMIIGGTTLHHYLGIGLGKGSVGAMTTAVFRKPWLRKRWIALETLIIDEVSMLTPELFDKLEEMARKIRRNEKPFGGIHLVFSGDFLQLPTVEGNKFCFESEKWEECFKNTIYLTKIIRQEDQTFQECLNEIRMGELSKKTKEIIESRVGAKLVNEHSIKPTRLFPLNRSVDIINKRELQKLIEKNGEVYEYPLEFEVYKKRDRDRVIQRYNKYVRAPESLELTEGCQIMLTHNLDPDYGLVNGSRGVITGFVEELPAVRFLNGQRRIIDYIIREIEENDAKIARYSQLPLRLGYAYSIHKSQGCSLDYAIVDLEDIFEHGQMYVSLSRVRTLEGLSIIGLDWMKFKAHPKAVEFYKNLEGCEDDPVSGEVSDDSDSDDSISDMLHELETASMKTISSPIS
jgi:ATP-dependent DNA helicase PIF1